MKIQNWNNSAYVIIGIALLSGGFAPPFRRVAALLYDFPCLKMYHVVICEVNKPQIQK